MSQQQPPPARSWRTVWVCLLYSLLWLQGLTTAYAQPPPIAVRLGQLPADGLLLNQGWRFRAGDDPNGASLQLDDQYWSRLDPTRDIRTLPQLRQARIGWLRLHLTTGADVPPVMMYVFQSVASEVYLDGRLLYRFGTIGSQPGKVRAYNPSAAYNLPLHSSTRHVLAIRVACQPDLDYDKKYLFWDAAAVQIRLFPAAGLPASQPFALEAAYTDTFKVGIAFILFILHLSLFFTYPGQRANGYATGMYLMLTVTFLARAANGFGHSMSLRMLLYYGSLIDVAVPAVALLTFYSLFNFRKGWLCWLAIASVGLRFVSLPAGYQGLSIFFDYYLQFELIRLSLLAIRRRLLGAHIVAVGAFINLGLWVGASVLSALHVPVAGNEWLFHIQFVVSFLCFPLTLSLRLALEHGSVNRQLLARLREVETLSARNLAQQQERQQLLARQNEQLEQQVAGRTQKLKQQTEQLRELDLVKSRFVTNVTHEFRTPLSLIIAPVEKMIQENRFDGPTLTLVHRNAEQLLRLINQLLDLSKLENNFMAVSLTQGNLTEFIGQTVTAFQQLAGQKGIILTYTTPDSFGREQVFDADKWEKILTNLLANALKFTPAGGNVTLTETPVQVAGLLTAVQFELVDSGIGIAPHALPHIFDRFYQADTSSTRAYWGTGIGLALVRELVDLLGGNITVESESGRGTTFRLVLPVLPLSTASDALSWPRTEWGSPYTALGTLDPLALSGPISSQPIGNGPAPRILVVEDNDELRAFLVGELSHSYQVFQAGDGQEGWAIAQAELPDIVLTDVMMPRMDGHQLTRLLKTHPDTDHIAVVMLTAKSAQQNRIEGLQQGADDYLAKPFSVAELHLRIRNLISRQQKLGDHYRQQFALPEAHPIPPAVLVDDPFLVRIYTLLEQHLDDPTISVDWLADQLAINRKTLYRKVQSLVQLPPADLIRQYRLRKAAELLGAGCNVAETADRVGFNTPSHFTIVFREFYHKTPTEFIASRVRSVPDRSVPDQTA